MIDDVLSNIPESLFPARLYMFEDKEAVIRMIVPISDTRHDLTVATWVDYLSESIWTVLFPVDMCAKQNHR